ncbi:uncharacterized protein PV06_08489 [Exophiala oligosperma]|uniref:Uncharacterized protein n=1 Tax=Exophiala oligosperma TaxID=215243 RepID=A0A0D2DBT0_9EURO|nr:uncharacterized protein PV06_08489 [Exophiala oligosperma]KIW39920.1 hypothetical protein PV06_08489 [Exophiala oligosperma]
MSLHFLGFANTPVFGVRSPRVDLEYVNRKLESLAHEPPQIRRTFFYDRSPRRPITPPFPDPMIPSSFFRTWALHKGQRMRFQEPKNDHRLSIDDVNYWRTEARYYSSLLEDRADLERQNIDEWTYWRTEATFWREAYCIKDCTTDRWAIQDSQYWKIEALHLAKVFRKNSRTSNMRQHIYDPDYWKTETFHYDDLLEKAFPPPSLDSDDLLQKPALQQNSNCKKRKFDDGKSWLAMWKAEHIKPSGDSVSSEVPATGLKKQRMTNTQ